MTVPASPRPSSSEWHGLPSDAKRAQLLETAGRLFAERGFDVPMAVLAEELGVGVGSLYRCLGSKQEIIVALVVGRLETVSAVFAGASGEDAWAALTDAIEQTLLVGAGDHVMLDAMELVNDHPEVQRARERVLQEAERVVARAREQGTVRSDATGQDVRLLMRAAMRADTDAPGSWRRVYELMIAGLRSPA
jgi:AcrR family transcriptional regulator